MLAIFSLLAHHTIYSMQDANHDRTSRNITPSVSYYKAEYLSEKITGRFPIMIQALRSFWYDKKSCDNVVRQLNYLVHDDTTLYEPHNSIIIKNDHRNFIRNNFHIILGHAQAARDYAKELYKESDENLAQKKALPRVAILEQANINLVYVKQILSMVKRNKYYPL